MVCGFLKNSTFNILSLILTPVVDYLLPRKPVAYLVLYVVFRMIDFLFLLSFYVYIMKGKKLVYSPIPTQL